MPSGASTGEREALELRDGDPKRYLGKGVTKAVAHVNGEIAAALRNRELSQRELDDGDDSARRHARPRAGSAPTRCSACRWRRSGPTRSGSSQPLYAHIAHLAGNTGGYLLPVPMLNILNGGAHADSNVDFQEFMVMPLGAPSFREGLRIGVEIFHALRGILKKRGLSTGVGDEGGFAPSLKSNREALERRARSGHAKPDIAPASDVYRRARRRVERVLGGDGRATLRVQEIRRAAARLRGHGGALRRLVPAVSDHLDRRRLRRRRLARLGDAHAASSARACSWWATTCS